MAKKKSVSNDNDLQQHLRVRQIALVFGYNELAKSATVLGDKVYYRLARDAAQEELIKQGGTLNVVNQETILTLPGHSVTVKFTEADIELMRQTVEQWDRDHPKEPSNGSET